MKVGEVYTYDSYSSTNIIKIKEVYFDTFQRESIKFDELDTCFEDNEIYYCFKSIRIESLKNNTSFKRKTKKDWYKVLRNYNGNWRHL